MRFQEWKGGILYGKIGPENNILPYLMEHFADRLPGESFILQDVNRKIAGLHPARREERGNKERKAGQGIWPTESSLTQGRESAWNRGEETCGFERGEHLPVKGREQKKLLRVLKMRWGDRGTWQVQNRLMRRYWTGCCLTGKEKWQPCFDIFVKILL